MGGERGAIALEKRDEQDGADDRQGAEAAEGAQRRPARAEGREGQCGSAPVTIRGCEVGAGGRCRRTNADEASTMAVLPSAV